VKTVDEGIELLTGVPAGVADEKGNYPENTVSYRVDKKLLTLAEGLKAFAEEGKPQPGRDEANNQNQGEGERSL
jgi:Lon-like ATP-dependent protease